ncbi:MAG: hypothetical protein BM556_18090 [Bacteriovorax sp. MedPE-SWde]|nr:MAG: hypothetical protein BM556_18090 [Bacteriovorax sp. MedPE-SWde]
MTKISFLLVISLMLSISVQARKPSYALTNTGGVSLGVYEAGYLHYLISSAKEKGKVNNLILSGASAGAINSFISVLEACSDKKYTPSTSLFWKSWLPLSLEKFYVKENNKSQGLLSRESLNDIFNELEIAWNEGLRTGCTSYLGVTVTRKSPLSYYGKDGLNFPRSQEFFAVKIVGRGKGKRPLIRNHNLGDGSVQAFLPLQNDMKNFSYIKNLLLASSSFPIAFEPTSLDHCLMKNTEYKVCKGEDIRNDLFIDGGIFNNAPIDVAYKISKSLKREARDQFLILDPGVKNYPIETVRGNTISEGLVSDTFSLLKNFVSSSRKGQVTNFLGNHPEMVERVIPIMGSLPLASEPLYGFFGFFERDFRIFDFYVGMLDASNIRNLNNRDKLTLKKFKESNADMLYLYCMQSVFNGKTDIILECLRIKEKRAVNNLKTLLMVSIERLFNQCRQVSPDVQVDNELCNLAIEGKGPEDFIGHELKDWMQYEGEPQVQYILRRLRYHGFHFKDLGLKVDEGDKALFMVKKKIVDASRLAAKTQPKNDRFVLNQFTSPALNFAFYVPSVNERSIFIGTNSSDLSFTKLFDQSSFSSWYRKVNYGVMINGLETLMKQESFNFGALPYIGLQFEKRTASSAIRQFNMGARIGYQFSSERDFKVGACVDKADHNEAFLSCSDFAGQFVVGVTFLESVKIQFIQQVMFFSKTAKEWPRYSSLLFGWQF